MTPAAGRYAVVCAVLAVLPARLPSAQVASQPALPIAPVATPIPKISGAVTGPGAIFESLMALKPGDDMAHSGYVAQEFFVSGVANSRPYKTRVVIRRPTDRRRFSGLVLAESMHPSGNAWMFHFTHRYSMSAGHIGLEILTSAQGPLVEFNRARYGELDLTPGQGSEILAQVGALIKSKESTNPLAGLPVRKVILAGTSASAAVLINYLPAHGIYRLPGGSPIYDGFLPTSTGATIRPVDVPMIQVPTMTEVAGGKATMRQDGDAPGDQFRVYEFPGMAHIDTRDAAAYYPNPCRYPISRFPFGAYMSVALDHLWKWVDRGVTPPRADRILVDGNTDNDGSVMALDESGNPRGGIRNPFVDVPARKYVVPNAGASPPVANAHPFVALRDAAAQDQLCRLAGYEVPMDTAQLRTRYRTKAAYRATVERRLDELTRQGWSLPVYRAVILDDARNVEF
jgi:alpha/beta hydrolase family protein